MSDQTMPDLDNQDLVREYGKKEAFLSRTLGSSRNRYLVAGIGLICLLVFVSIPIMMSLRPGASIGPGRNRDDAFHSAVAADSPLCSDLALNTAVEAGGNAVDMAVIAVLCQGVVRPFASGLGGGGFATVYLSDTGEAWTVNFREKAPAAATWDMYINKTGLASKGPLASGVPGEICGLHAMHQRAGVMKWDAVVAPALSLAKDGFAVDKQLAVDLALFNGTIFDTPSLRDEFAPDGVMLKESETLRRPQLADTLLQIQEYGADVFYNGILAKKLAADIRRMGGIITAEDLATYTCPISTEDVVRTKFRGYQLLGSTLPSGSAIVGMVLAVLSELESKGKLVPADFSPQEPASQAAVNGQIEYFHSLIETMKFGFGDRSRLGDPLFANLTGVFPDMLSPDHVNKISRLITDRTHPDLSYYYLFNQVLDDHGTSHLSTMDDFGNAVSITSTVNFAFGAKWVAPSLGIVMNDQMDDFSTDPLKPNGFKLKPSPSNYVAGGKRPLSSMSPTVVLSKNETGEGGKHPRALFALGGSGGPTIISGVLQVLIHLMNGLTPAESIGRPRIHTQLSPDYVVAEDKLDQRVMAGLRARGHNMVRLNGTLPDGQLLGVVQVVAHRFDNITAASDPRKKGMSDMINEDA